MPKNEMGPMRSEVLAEIEASARSMAQTLDAALHQAHGRRVGFMLFLFEYKGPELTYISNGVREDCLEVIEDWCRRQRSGDYQPPMPSGDA